jgi:hypothetical protein
VHQCAAASCESVHDSVRKARGSVRLGSSSARRECTRRGAALLLQCASVRVAVCSMSARINLRHGMMECAAVCLVVFSSSAAHCAYGSSAAAVVCGSNARGCVRQCVADCDSARGSDYCVAVCISSMIRIPLDNMFKYI